MAGDVRVIVTVYSKPGCVQCTATYKRLDMRGVEYDVVDISDDPGARDYVLSLGYSQAPVVFVDKDNHWGGYNPSKIDAL